jgi:beta-lactam-binding protein with PASTA domain
VLIRAAIIVVLITVTAGVLAWFGFTAYVRTDVTVVPNVTGMTLNQAYDEVFDANLQLDWYPVPSNDAANEAILEQSPPAGEHVRTGRTVNVGVRIPTARSSMPSLVGLTLTEAETRLADSGIDRPDLMFTADTQAQQGTVVAQEPAAGVALTAGQRPKLTVSRGGPSEPSEPPNVVGLNLQEAEATLRQAGFRYIVREPAPASDRNVGRVLSQSPSGTETSPQDPVVLTYGTAGQGFVRVPDVVGLSEQAARARLQQAGLKVLDVRVTQRSDRPAGVTTVAPDGMTVEQAGVIMTLNRPPDAPETPTSVEAPMAEPTVAGSVQDAPDQALPATIQATAPLRQSPTERRVDFRFDPDDVSLSSLQTQPYRLELVVEDAGGRRSLFDTRVPGGTAVEATVFVEGDEALLQTFVNGVFFQAWRP